MQPLSIPIGLDWLGNDGPWSSFQIGIGTPYQPVKLLPTISSSSISVINPQACDNNKSQPSCKNALGGFFDNSTSTTWELVEKYTSSGDIYGYDSVMLGVSGSQLKHQLISSVPASDFIPATFGLRSTPSASIDSVNNSISPVPSLLQSLKSAGYISSLSWGYTAGSFSVFQGSGQSGTFGYGSLTLGGYDAAYFEPNNLTFALKKDNGTSFEDFVVDVSAIQMLEGLNSAPLTFGSVGSISLDMSTSFFWLPQSMCDSIGAFLNLTYDPGSALYLVNDTVHEALLARNISLRFLISENSNSSESATILPIGIPYSSLALRLNGNWPGIPAGTTYVPIRREREGNGFTIGRPFLQHAYLIADYERSSFSVYQALFPSDGTQDLRLINPISVDSNLTAPTSSNQWTPMLSSAEIAGIVVGSIVFLIAILTLSYFIWRKKNRAMVMVDINKTELEHQSRSVPEELESKPENVELHARSLAEPELEGDINHPSELRGADRPGELAAGKVTNDMRVHVPPRYKLQA